jgi:hypothetical protein
MKSKQNPKRLDTYNSLATSLIQIKSIHQHSNRCYREEIHPPMRKLWKTGEKLYNEKHLHTRIDRHTEGQRRIRVSHTTTKGRN